MEPTELTLMIQAIGEQHIRLHEIWQALHANRDDHPVLMAALNSSTSTVSAHLDALYLLRTLLEQDALVQSQKGA
jgi:hypothetical protein